MTKLSLKETVCSSSWEATDHGRFLVAPSSSPFFDLQSDNFGITQPVGSSVRVPTARYARPAVGRCNPQSGNGYPAGCGRLRPHPGPERTSSTNGYRPGLGPGSLSLSGNSS